MFRKEGVVGHLRGLIETNLERHKIATVHGRATFTDPHTICVRQPQEPDRILTAPFILIATGSYPNWPENTPKDPLRLYDSDSILEMDRIPKSLAVIGSGVIGCEYATMFKAMGIEVTLVGDGPDRDSDLRRVQQKQCDVLGHHQQHQKLEI
jgi:NAD(P) transhydrogenase